MYLYIKPITEHVQKAHSAESGHTMNEINEIYWPNLAYGVVFQFNSDMRRDDGATQLYVRCKDDILNLKTKISYGNCTEIPITVFEG